MNILSLDNLTPLGMKMEISNNILLEHLKYDDSHVPESEDFTLTCDSGGEIPLHHTTHYYAKIFKCEGHIYDNIKACIERTLNALLGTVLRSVSAELNQHIENKNKKTCQ